ncbi:ribosome maturation factor RimP [Clostridia bacterium]|nr:ribosome maturation factor RimP [Clostridia bacterium]
MKRKKFNPTEKRVYEKAKELTDEFGYDLWDVEFVKEGAEKYLRVLIDKEDGISIEDCEKITKPLDKWLDAEDFISESYIFEVGSAGIDRDLRTEEHFEWAIGEQVQVKFIRPVNNEKEIIGILQSYNTDTIIIDNCEFKIENISRIRLWTSV